MLKTNMNNKISFFALVTCLILVSQFTLVDVVVAEPVATGTSSTPIAWTDRVSVTVENDALIKAGATGWNSGAASVQTIPGDGAVEFSAVTTDTYRMLGLSNSNASAAYDTIGYAIYLRIDGTLSVYENGTHRGRFGTYQGDDVLRVERSGSTVVYRRNGAIFYTSTVPSTGALLADAALRDAAARFDSATIYSHPTNSVPDSGWSEFTPAAYDTSEFALTDLQQPGSRIFYISAEDGSDPAVGEDPKGQIYFWDGTQIVDATGSATGDNGVAYGTDPMNPTGPVKPYKRWSYVAPRRSGWGIEPMKVGAPWDGTSYRAPGQGGTTTRHEFPDWWLFKRGETFDLHADYLSFAQETTPSLTTVQGAGGTLAVSGGKSKTEMKIVGAYGNLSKPRPRFINPIAGSFIRYLSDIKHIAYLSLHLDGRGDTKGGGFTFLYQTPAAENILLEDLWMDGTKGSSIQSTSAQITLRRSMFTDAWASRAAGETGHVQGLYTSGNRDARIRIEESIFMRNGFRHGDPAITGWPPKDTQTYDIFDRNMYLSGECDNMECGVFDSISMIGASGDQFRPGMRIERNFFYQGYLAMGAHGGYPDEDGSTGTFLDNVLQRFHGSGTDDNRGHPGWGIELTSGANLVEVARNIVTGAQHEASFYALQLSSLGWYCYSHQFHYPTRNNLIHDNIFDSASAPEAIRVIDGLGDACDSPWVFPGVTNNQIVNNILINALNSDWEYRPATAAAGTTNDTLVANNTIYPDRDTAASALGWTDPNRTLKTYLQTLGHSVNSDDGFIEFFNEATQQRKGYWRTELTSRPLVNYMRKGFGMDALPKIGDEITNMPPVLDPIADITVNEGDTVIFNPTATDPDADALTFSYSGWISSPSYATTFTDAGVYTITVTVTDGALTDSQDVTVTVANVNRTPVLDLITDISVTEGETITLTPTATDPDGDTLSFSYTNWMTSNSYATVIGDTGTHIVTITVDDGHGGSDSQTVTVTVNAENFIPAFPGAEGYGAKAIGGRGGRIVKVTNLNDSGPGSFREAVTSPPRHWVNPNLYVYEPEADFIQRLDDSGHRIVVFEVSGIINLESGLNINTPYLTIAGETSPGGILVTGYQTTITNHDVIMRHMRFRVGSHRMTDGADPETLDSFDILGKYWGGINASNIMIDHCSFSWGVDETVTFSGGVTNTTIQWSVVSEGLSHAGHPKGEHSKGLLVSGKYEHPNSVSIHHNYIAHNTARNPMIASPANVDTRVDVVNNVVYNWHGGLAPTSAGAAKINWDNNYAKQGVDSNSYSYEVILGDINVAPNPQLYVHGNIGSTRLSQSAPNWNVGFEWRNQLLDEAWRRLERWDAPIINSSEMSLAVANNILSQVGATAPMRDSVDKRVIADFDAGTGSIIDNIVFPDDFPVFQNLPAPVDSDNDGMADSWELEQELNVGINDSALDQDGNGYTNIEEYLHHLSTISISSNRLPPSITAQPIDQTISLNNSASFNVAVLGSTPLTYQWQKDNVDISGATDSNYTIVAVHSDDAATYRVVVTNSEGSVTSAGATLIVSSITPHPQVSWESEFSLDSLNLDSDGWSNLTPSADSRLIYVSNSGNDTTGQVYSIADVGTNPHNPSGTVNAFKTITVAMNHLRSGYPDWLILERGDEWIRDEYNQDYKFLYYDTENGSNTYGTEGIYSYDDVNGDPYNPPASINIYQYSWKPASIMASVPAPYWILRKRGDQWVADTSTIIKTKAGRSPTERSVITYYGNENAARPLIKTGNGSGLSISSAPYFAAIGIKFYADKRDPQTPNFVGFDKAANVTGFSLYTGSGGTPIRSILIEDCVFEYYGNNTIQSADHVETEDVIIRRSQILNTYGTGGHAQGLMTAYTSALLEENLFDHNGWYKQADGNGHGEGQATMFNHNSYFSSTKNTIFRNNIFSRASSIDTKFTANSPTVYYDGNGDLIPDDELGGYERTPGGYIIIKPGIITAKDEISVSNLLIDNNFYFGGEIAMSVGGNNDWGHGYRWQNIHINNNVLTEIGRAEGSNGRNATDRNFGWGMEIKDWNSGTIANNYLVNYGDSIVTNTYGMQLEGHFIDVDIYDNVISNIANGFAIRVNGDIDTTRGGPKEDLHIWNNSIQLAETNAQAIRTEYTAPGTFYDNTYHSGLSADSWFRLNGTDVDFDDWIAGSGDTSVAQAPLDYISPDVSLAGYNLSLGGIATAEAFIEKAKEQHRYNWDSRYTSKAVNTYFRAGFTIVGENNGNTTPPDINAHPETQTITEGNSVTFTVEASGDGLSYQWQKDGSDIASANSASFTIPLVSNDDAGTYRVIVSNSYGSITSDTFSLTVSIAEDLIENYGANAFYKPYYGTLKISPNNDGTSTIAYTGAEQLFSSDYLNKEFVAFRIHQNPLETNDVDKYFPNTLGSRYSKVIDVVDNKTLIVDFAYNGGDIDTPITSENASGYFFFDNKTAFTSAITSSERGEVITLKENAIYVTKGGWNAITPSNIILKSQNNFTSKARIKISAEDVMGQRGSDLPETGHFLSTLFKLDVADFDITIRDINVIGPHYSAIAMQENAYYYGLFGGTTPTEQQARTLELYGSDDWTEYYELRDSSLLQYLPDGYNFVGPNFIFGIIYAGKHDAYKVTDMLVLNCINSNMHLRSFSSMKTNNGAGIYKRIIGESPDNMSEIIEQDLPENYINPVALSSDMAVNTKLKVLDDTVFGGKRIFKITGYGSWLQLANQYWWGGTNTNQGQDAYIRVQHNTKSYNIKLGNEGDWNYLSGSNQVIDSFIDNATVRGIFQIPKAGDQFTIGSDFKAGNDLVVVDKNTIEVWGWSIQAGDQLDVDGVTVNVVATEEKYKKVGAFDPTSPLAAGYIHYLSLTLDAAINLNPSAISVQTAQLEFLLDGNEHAVELTQTGGVVGHLFYDDFNMPYHFENVNLRGFFRGSDRPFKDTSGNYIGWMLPNVDLLDEGRIRLWRNATYSDDNPSPGQWMTSIQNATADYNGLPFGTYRTLFDGEKTKVSQLFMHDCARDLPEIKNNPDLTHARLCNPKIDFENIQAHGGLLLYTTENNQINIGTIDATNPADWSSISYYPDGGALNIQNLQMNEEADAAQQGVLHIREQSTLPYSLYAAQGNAFVRINSIAEDHINSDITLNNWTYGLYPYTSADDGYDFYQNNVLINNPTLLYDNYCSRINVTDTTGNSILANCLSGDIPTNPGNNGSTTAFNSFTDATFSNSMCTNLPIETPVGVFASPTGVSSATGAQNDPLDLATALSSTSIVQQGETLWLMEGTYRGSFTSNLRGTSLLPISVKPLPGKRAIIDGNDPSGSSALSIKGEWTNYYGLEVMSSSTTHTSLETGSNPTDLVTNSGVTVTGPNTKIINFIVHDNVGSGMNSWSNAPDSELYGNIIYNNGWTGPDRGHGHAIYAQNNTGIKKLTNNIIFFGYGTGIHVYTEGGQMNNFDVQHNAWFMTGASDPRASQKKDNCLIGGFQPVNNLTLKNNLGYSENSRGTRLGYGGSVTSQNAILADNYLNENFWVAGEWTSLDTSNTSVFRGLTGSASSFIADGASGNVVQSTPPDTGNKVFVRANDHDPRRARVVIYNYNDAAAVDVNLNTVLKTGEAYRIHSSFALFEAPMIEGVYDGSPVSIPMGTIAPPQPTGSNDVTDEDYPHKKFGVFIVTHGGC